MKPYFSIRILINPLDSFDEGGERDECSIKLSIARQTDRGDDDGDAQLWDEINVCETLLEAVLWLSNKAPASDADKFLAYFASILFAGNHSAFEEFLEGSADDGDADFGDMIRRIAEKCKEKGI